MLALLDPAVLNQVDELRGQFAANLPFRHVVIEPLLKPDLCDALMAEFPSFDAGQSLNERGEAGRKAVFPDLARLGPAYRHFDDLMRSPDFLSLIGRITGIPELLYDPEYVGGGTHENLDGQELDTHVDFNYHPGGRLHRRLNLIVFLNRQWEESWGGCLELLRDPWAMGEGVRTVVPVANRCVIFETTESSWHGFRRINLPAEIKISRRSIAVYFYTKSRPAPQTGPSHGTVYYQRPLPEHLRAGRTLLEADVEEMQSLLARRDKQIQFLYDRELKFSQVVDGITRSPSFRLGRALTWPARAVRALLATRRQARL